MDLPKQTDPANLPAIRKAGCRAFSLLAIPQLHTNKVLAQKYLDAIFTMALVEPKVLEADASTGTEEHQLINWAFWCLGFPRLRGRQVGIVRDPQAPVPVAEYWGGRPVAHHFEICHWKTTGPDGHWCVFEPGGEVELYDPWDSDQAVGIPGISDHWVIQKQAVDTRLLYHVWAV